jgi:hypothetical protein
MSATRAQSIELPCGLVDQRAMLAMGISANVMSMSWRGISCFAYRPLTVGARQGSYGQNAENSRGGIFGI